MLAARPFAGQWFKALRVGNRALAGRRVRLCAARAPARQPTHRLHVHAAAARRDHAQHADRAAPDPAQQVDRALRAAPGRPAADGARAARRRQPGARAARARDPVRLRPRRPERRAGAGNRGLRVPGDGPRPGARAHGARGGRRGDLRRRRGRGRAEVRRDRPRECGGGDVLRHRALAGDRAGGAPPAPGAADPRARARRDAPRGPARGRRHGGRAGNAGSGADARLEHAAHTAGAGLARHPHGRRDPQPALQGAALGDRARSGRSRRRIRDLPRGTAHGGVAARGLVDRPVHQRDPRPRRGGVVHRGAARRHRGPRPRSRR